MIPYAEGAKFKDEDEVSLPDTKKINWYDKVLLNRPSKVILIFILAAIVAPLLLYNFIFFTSGEWPPADGYSLGSCLVDRNDRLPCGEGSTMQSECHPLCCYDVESDFCFHRFPSRFSFIWHSVWTEAAVWRPRINTVPYALKPSISGLRISIDEVSATHLSLAFFDSRENNSEGRRVDNKTYNYQVVVPEASVIVTGSQGTIFNTSRGPMIASENIWEITFRLTNEAMYGLGELPLRPGTVKVIHNHKGGLSSVPLIYAKINGSYHGLLIDVETPTEITILGNNNVIVRSIGNWGLKFHLFVGPKPEDIMRDVLSMLGNNKALEYWMLGAHICSENLKNIADPVNHLREFISNASLDRLQYESHCGVKPIVFKETKDDEDVAIVETGAQIVTDAGKRFVPHVSPYIRFENDLLEETTLTTKHTTDNLLQTTAVTDDTAPKTFESLVRDFPEFMLQWNTTEIYSGSIADIEDDIAYPDYGVVSDAFLEKLWTFNLTMDGIVLENNWPLDNSEKQHNETYVDLPYFNTNFEHAFNDTPQWNIIRPLGGSYIYEHNKYSNNFIDAFRKISNDSRIWSTSQWMRTDVVISRQNIDASWANLQKELTKAALGGISGHYLWSSPICGDTNNFNIMTQVNLCVKWYMAGTYFPMFRIHSNAVERHPLAFRGTHKSLIMNALQKRLILSPYFYTVMQDGPLLRPMFYQYPSSDALSDLTSQFSVGDDLLIAPNLLPSQSHVHVHMPPGVWFEFWGGLKIAAEEDEVITMTTTEADFLTFIRAGAIIVIQNSNLTSVQEIRQTSPYTLIIAAETTANSLGQTRTAKGKLFITETMTLNFKLNDTDLVITVEGDDFGPLCSSEAISANVIKVIKIFGLKDWENNFDHHKEIDTDIELCELETADEIIFAIDS